MGCDLNKKTKFTIGRLASASGVGISTVRYYQKRGLLRQPDRPSSGAFRSYGEQDLQRLLMIKEAQDFGFTLAEIADLVLYIDQNDCHAIKTLANRKLQDIKVQIRQLQNMRHALDSLISTCTQCDSNSCTLIARLKSRTIRNLGKV